MSSTRVASTRPPSMIQRVDRRPIVVASTPPSRAPSGMVAVIEKLHADDDPAEDLAWAVGLAEAGLEHVSADDTDADSEASEHHEQEAWTGSCEGYE